jgi:hypothetical protein
MFTMSGFRNLEREGSFGRRVAAYRFKAKGHVTVFVRSMLDPSYCPWKSYVVTRPVIFVYCKLGVAKMKLERSPAPFDLAT